MRSRPLLAALLLTFSLLLGRASAEAPPSPPLPIKPIEFERETLPNGLRVIYAPMRNAPVVHVRVLYHVGSRDEKPDRQGFAHMFEHMMFRGSKHVGDDEHGRLIGIVGGDSNAFTSFDQTTYINTIPANQLNMVLWLEADRMASYKVNKEVFSAERNVVAEEWRLRTANPPYGSILPDLFKTAFAAHTYKWLPIGDMDQLRQSSVGELQEFWNTYYIPNNACLIIAGDIDVAKTKDLVKKYFAWIPAGPEIKRNIPEEPKQDEQRKLDVYRKNIPLTVMLAAIKTPKWGSEDNVALDVLSSIIGDGRSSRLNTLLVDSQNPLCVFAGAGMQQLQDCGIFTMQIAVLPGKNADDAELAAVGVLQQVIEHGVTQAELDKIRTQQRIAIVRNRETAFNVAGLLGEAEVFGGDANLVNRDVDKLNALTPADLQAVAKKYLDVKALSVVRYTPDPLGQKATAVEDKAEGMKTAAVVDDGREVQPRAIDFPPDHPATAPTSNESVDVNFNKGEQFEVNGVQVVVMRDDRLPVINWTLGFRGGSDAEPAGREGLGGIATDMVRRGFAGLTYSQINEELESRGISLEVSDGGDYTSIGGQATVDQIDHAISRARDLITTASFPEDEYAKLIEQATAGLRAMLTDPPGVADRDLAAALWGDAPAGRAMTFKSLQDMTLDENKAYISSMFRKDGAFIVFAGDITVDRARQLAEQLTGALKEGKPPEANYEVTDLPPGRRIILVDNPDGKQANIRMAVRAFKIDSPEKFAGSIATRLLSDGTDSRLNKYVRGEKGLSYGVGGVFSPTRHTGQFNATTDTNPDTVAASIEAMFKVLTDMKDQEIPTMELAEGKSRITGGMALQMQTIGQQMSKRIDMILNGYPLDYFDTYPKKIDAVSGDDVRGLLKKYVDEGRMSIVVVGPASVIKPQLDPLGNVEVQPMPMQRPGMAPPEEPGLLSGLGNLFGKKKPATQPSTQPGN